MNFLDALNPVVQHAIAFILAGLVGMFLHYVKKWAAGDIVGNFFKYMVLDHPKNSIATLVAFFTATAAAFATGTIDGMQPLAIVGSGFTLGFTLDSAVNKGATP